MTVATSATTSSGILPPTPVRERLLSRSAIASLLSITSQSVGAKMRRRGFRPVRLQRPDGNYEHYYTQEQAEAIRSNLTPGRKKP